MTKRINESNANGIRAALDILNESAEEEVVETAEETNEEADEVSEAAEFDIDETQGNSKGEEYQGIASKPGQADIKIRQVGNTGDNPMACLENDLYKSFLEYLKEAEEAEAKEADEAEEVNESEEVEEASDEDDSEK